MLDVLVAHQALHLGQRHLRRDRDDRCVHHASYTYQPPRLVLVERRPQQVRHRDDACEHVVGVYYGQTPKLVLEQHLPSLPQWCGAADGDHLGCHDVPHAQLFQLGEQLVLRQVRDVRGRGTADIAVRDDPDEGALGRHDGQVTNPSVAHHLVRYTHQGLRGHRRHRGGHKFLDRHRLSFSSVPCGPCLLCSHRVHAAFRA